MEPNKQEIKFWEADQRYDELKQQRDAGTLTDEEFDARLKDLMVKDEEGRWWSKHKSTGEWYRRTASGDWVRDEPKYTGPRGGGGGGGTDGSGPSRWPRAALALAGSGFLVLVVILIAISIAIRPGPEVPEVVGQTESEAERAVANNYNIRIKSMRVDDQPKGTIIEQNPQPGEPAEQGSTISVVVSAGQPPDPGDIFSDDFSKTSSGWDQSEGKKREPWLNDYRNGLYRIYKPPPSSPVPALTTGPGTVENAIVEVDATLESDDPGTDAYWGVICRAQDYNNYYVFRVRADRRTAIWKKVEDRYSPLALSPVSKAVRGGKEENHLQADCVGSKLTFYVNGQKVAEAEDSTFASGQVGLEAENGGGKTLEVVFDNYLVSSP